MKRRIISLLLSLCLIAAVMPVYASAETGETIGGTCGDNATWELGDQDDYGRFRLIISGTGRMYDYTQDNVPWSAYKDEIYAVEIWRNITYIGAYAFSGMTLGIFSMPDTLTEIGPYALYNCSGISLIIMPNSVVTIGKSAFEGCNDTGVTLSDSLKYIGDYAFADNKISVLNLPESVISVGDYAFANCTGMHTVRIWGSPATIGENAFSGCSDLEMVYYYGSAPSIGSNAFNSVTADVHYPERDSTWSASVRGNYGGNLTYIPYKHADIDRGEWGEVGSDVKWTYYSDGTMVISGTGAMLDCYFLGESYGWVRPWETYLQDIKAVVVEDGITRIGNESFSGATNLQSITVADSVENIGMRAFAYCDSLTDISFGSGLKHMEDGVFLDCDGLTEFRFPDADVEYENHFLAKCSNLKTIVFSKKMTVIAGSMFESCAALESITIPNTITEIGANAFASCTNLREIVIPGSITQIGDNAFARCSKLESVSLNEGLKQIDSGVFAHCPSLSSITIPASVTKMNDTFRFGEGLSSIKFLGNWPLGGDCLFEDLTLTAYYPSNNKTWIEDVLLDYRGTVTWKSYESSITPNKYIAEGTCGDYVNWVITDTYTLVISGNGFMNCLPDAYWANYSGIVKNVVIEPGVTSIAAHAFSDFYKVESITIPDTVTYIGDGAMHNCLILEEIIIPAGVQEVCDGIFSECHKLKVVYFRGDAPVFEKGAFSRRTFTAYYPANNPTWTSDVLQNYEGTITWVPDDHEHSYTAVVTEPTCIDWGYTSHTCPACNDVYIDTYKEPLGHTWDKTEGVSKTCTVCGQSAGGYQIELPVDEAGQISSVWIDGKEYPVKQTDSGYTVDLEQENATNLVVYTYNDPNATDVHTQYPTGMKVWMLDCKDGSYSAKYISKFDNLLQYSGSSIRIAGKKGIRMITSISKETKTALTGKGIDGYTLLEYGTLLGFASELDEENALVLGKSYAKSNYAYKKGVADPVFKDTGKLVQYTNVLVGFSNDQCKDDIAMRPYIILQNKSGEKITIYGGVIYRSIGYIAYQNRTVFNPGTNAYNFVWEIIHHVYGNKYDADYKG